MKLRYFLLFSTLLTTSACTIYPSKSGMETDLTLPLVGREWEVQKHSDPQTHQQFCVISAGHNAVKVILEKGTNGTIKEAVKSTRSVHPGIVLKARVNRHHYMTAEDFFPLDSTAPLISDLQQGDVLYLEWWDAGAASRGSGGGVQKFTNMIKLDTFKQHYQQCQSQ